MLASQTIRVADLAISRAVDETALVITTANGETNHATEQTIGKAAATTAASINEDEAHTQGPTSAHGHLRLDTANRGILIPQTVTCPVVARIVMIPEDADAGRTDRRGQDLLAHRGLPKPVAGETLPDENSTRARGRGLVPLGVMAVGQEGGIIVAALTTAADQGGSTAAHRLRRGDDTPAQGAGRQAEAAPVLHHRSTRGACPGPEAEAPRARQEKTDVVVLEDVRRRQGLRAEDATVPLYLFHQLEKMY